MKAKQQGFTLIELLIATSLLSMVIYLGTFSYGLFAQGWSTRLNGFNQTANQTRNLILFRNVLQGTVPLVVENKDRQSAIFFNGESQQLTGISLNGIFESDSPVVYQLVYDPDSSNLFYSEVSTRKTLLTEFEQPVVFDRHFVLFENLADSSFEYFGWPSFNDKLNVSSADNESRQPAWFTQYSGDSRKILPDIIKITLRYQDGREDQLQSQTSQASHYVMSKSIKGDS